LVLLLHIIMTLHIIQNNYSDHHTQQEVPILIQIGHIPNIIQFSIQHFSHFHPEKTHPNPIWTLEAATLYR